MKKVSLRSFAVGASLVAAAMACAQAAGPAGGAPPAPAALAGHKGPLVAEREILAKLNLSLTQRDQVKTALKTAADSLKDLRKSEKGEIVNPGDRKVKRQAIMKTYMDSLKTILTAEQLTQYKALRKELRKKEAEAKAAATGTPAAGPTPSKTN